MTAPTFVPLVPGALPAALNGPTRLKPISSTPPAKFETANPAKMKTEAPAPAPHTGHGQPTISLERQGDTITHIRVQCACGQVIELKCEY